VLTRMRIFLLPFGIKAFGANFLSDTFALGYQKKQICRKLRTVQLAPDLVLTRNW
jgi:hypothetical protein